MVRLIFLFSWGLIHKIGPEETGQEHMLFKIIPPENSSFIFLFQGYCQACVLQNRSGTDSTEKLMKVCGVFGVLIFFTFKLRIMISSSEKLFQILILFNIPYL